MQKKPKGEGGGGKKSDRKGVRESKRQNCWDFFVTFLP